MTKPRQPFERTYHCLSGWHCTVCRDRSAGRPMREQWSLRFTLPQGVVDFKCPHGREWGFRGKGAALADPDVQVCLGCHDNRTCPNVQECCGGKLNVVIRVPCPKGRF